MTGSVLQIVLGALLAAAIAFLSHRLRLLTIGGSLAQFGVGWLLFGLGGWQWGVPVVVFFVLSSILARLTDAPSRTGSDLFAKGGTRDELQVAANGGLAAAAGRAVGPHRLGRVLCWLPRGRCASAADTWATEVGMTSPHAPRSDSDSSSDRPGSVRRGHPSRPPCRSDGGAGDHYCPGSHGLSARVRLLLRCGRRPFLPACLIRFLGRRLQLQFRCAVCGRLTERALHCGIVAEHASGRPWLTQ